jgi:hypothetical protein
VVRVQMMRGQKPRVMRMQLIKTQQMRMELLETLVRIPLAQGATAAVIVSASVRATACIISLGATITGSQRTAECSPCT